MEDQLTAGSLQLLTELLDKMMDQLYSPAGTTDATRAEDMSMIVDIQDATPERMKYRLLEFQQLIKPLWTTANGQIRQLRLNSSG